MQEKWPDGPWDKEPDRLSWIDGEYRCEMIRHSNIGHWCGYVTVPEGHPWIGRRWDELADVNVHGGITFATDRNFGFDCCHLYDAWPNMPKTLADEAVYRDEKYVRREVERLLEQAKEATK